MRSLVMVVVGLSLAALLGREIWRRSLIITTSPVASSTPATRQGTPKIIPAQSSTATVKTESRQVDPSILKEFHGPKFPPRIIGPSANPPNY